MNIVGIIGRLTRDPELRRTGEGTAVCSYSLAVNRPKVKDTVDFINCVTWRQGAEFLSQYGNKGDHVAVTGSLQSRKWKDKDGKDRTEWEVVTESVELLSSRKSESNSQAPTGKTAFPGASGGPQNGFTANPYGSAPYGNFQQQGFPYGMEQQGFSDLEVPGKLPF